jgi:RNA polymerase sigma factor (TIGR02999 family)
MPETIGMAEITRLLNAAADGDALAQTELVDAVYRELHRLASSYMRREHRREHTLQPTALVHEAYMLLIGDNPVNWDNRAHFYSAAAKTMRRILVDHARRCKAGKRFGKLERVELEEGLIAVEDQASELLELNDALDRLALLDERQAHMVEMRFFGGLTVEEAAKAAGVSEKTVKRDWALARAWLQNELRR